MSNIKWLSVIVLSVALSGAAYAAGRGGGGHGGGGHGGGGHGGGGHGGGHVGGGGHGGGAHFAGRGGGGAHFARGGGARFSGGGHRSAGRAAVSRAAGGSNVRANRAVATPSASANLSRQNAGNPSRQNASVHANAIHHALAAHAVAGALHNRNALHNPAARARIAAVAATAGLHGHDRRGGFGRHRNGGFGWVGPLFWPFAYYDLSDYAMWGYDPSLWDYGYGDIYAGIFTPYGYGDLTGYLPSSGTPSAGSNPAPSEPNELAQLCGDDSREIAGLPIDRIQQALNPNDEQRKALDDFANASVQAAQTIKTACPTQVTSTAPGRLAAMQSRLEAMISAVRLVEPPLDHFYGLLNDEQKARLTALGQEQQRGSGANGVLAQQGDCGNGQAGVTNWPAAELEQRLHPTDAQRTSLNSLKDASAKAADMLKGACQSDQSLTPPARLAAAGKRLDIMLQAVETVKASLDDLYGELNDEQKAQFESIGPGGNTTLVSAPRDAVAPADAAPPSRHHRRHHASVVGLVRRLIGF